MSFDLTSLIQSAGYLGIFAIVFAESGLFFGFFLPGDSLLFTAGFLASQGFFSISLLLVIVIVAAILGDSVGYWFGRRAGDLLYSRTDSKWFKQEHLEKGKKFYDSHGTKAIVLARFIPIVRTFAPIVAGTTSMTYRTFLIWNIIGGFFWTLLVTLLGYFLGASIPNIDHYLLPMILGIIIVSILPIGINYLKNRTR